MVSFHASMPDPKTRDAAVTLGEAIKAEYGRWGVSGYLAMLGELFPRAWTDELAAKLDTPNPPPDAPKGQDGPAEPFAGVPKNAAPRPPEPKAPKPDMEKLLHLMQLMGSMKQ